MNCTPSAILETQFPDTTSEAAKEGTLAHELAEAKVMHYMHIDGFTKRKLTIKTNKLKKDPLWQAEIVRSMWMRHGDRFPSSPL